jgi:hypothetical protein
VFSKYPNVAKIPVVIEINEKATAKESKDRIVRKNFCEYPNSFSSSFGEIELMSYPSLKGLTESIAVKASYVCELRDKLAIFFTNFLLLYVELAPRNRLQYGILQTKLWKR